MRFDNHCGTTRCPCTHTDGCDHGWLEDELGGAIPCPVCKPGRQRHTDEDRDSWLQRLRQQDKAWAVGAFGHSA